MWRNESAMCRSESAGSWWLCRVAVVARRPSVPMTRLAVSPYMVRCAASTDLERDPAVRLVLFSEIDDAHAALAEDIEDAVATDRTMVGLVAVVGRDSR
jgi:hypothetical protein